MNVREIDKQVDRFYKLYETKCWKDNELEIFVEMIDNNFLMSLMKDEEVLDAILFCYNKDERIVYRYMMIKFFLMLLGNVMIYQDENVFFNEKHKDYLNVLVEDKELLELFTELRNTQDNLDKRNEIVNEAYKMIPFNKRYTSLEFDEGLKGRYYVSAKKLSRKI